MHFPSADGLIFSHFEQARTSGPSVHNCWDRGRVRGGSVIRHKEEEACFGTIIMMLTHVNKNNNC